MNAPRAERHHVDGGEPQIGAHAHFRDGDEVALDHRIMHVAAHQHFRYGMAHQLADSQLSLRRLGSISRVETARTAQKAASARGVTHASLPPATIAVASPRLMISKASPIACAPEAQAETVQ